MAYKQDRRNPHSARGRKALINIFGFKVPIFGLEIIGAFLSATILYIVIMLYLVKRQDKKKELEEMRKYSNELDKKVETQPSSENMKTETVQTETPALEDRIKALESKLGMKTQEPVTISSLEVKAKRLREKLDSIREHKSQIVSDENYYEVELSKTLEEAWTRLHLLELPNGKPIEPVQTPEPAKKEEMVEPKSELDIAFPDS